MSGGGCGRPREERAPAKGFPRAAPGQAAALLPWLVLGALFFASLPSALWSAWPGWLGPAAFGDPQPLASLAGRLGLFTALAAGAAGLLLVRQALGGSSASAAPNSVSIGLLLLAPWVLGKTWASAATAGNSAFDAFSAGLPYALFVLGFSACESLQPKQRSMLLDWLPLQSLLASSAALLTAGFDLELGLAGVLGNSGPSTQLALPGAVLGLWALATRPGRERWIAAAAVAGFLTHAILAPAIGALLAFSIAALTLLASHSSPIWRWRGRLGLALLIALSAINAIKAWQGIDRPTPRATPAIVEGPGDPGDLGGVEVRLRLWRSFPAALQLDETGRPGGFERAYESVRDPLERELSARTSGGPTAVEHLHNDWLQAFLDLGWWVGVWFPLAWLLGSIAALRRGPGSDPALRPYAAAWIGLAVLSLQHAPFSRNAAVALLGGWLIASIAPRAARSAAVAAPWRRLRAGALALLLISTAVAAIQPALGLTEQGLKLARALPALAQAQAAGESIPSLLPLGALSNYASPLALSLAERLEQAPKRRLELARRYAGARPYDAGGLNQLGLAELALGNRLEALGALERATELAPGDPVLNANLARLLLEHGGEVELLEASERRLPGALAALPEAARRALVLEAQRQGWATPQCLAQALLEPEALANTPLPQDPNAPIAVDLGARIDALAEAAPEDSPERASLRSLAHHLWARQNAQDGHFDDALRSYRQALRQSRWGAQEGSPLIRAELAAAARLVGNRTEAQETAPEAVSVRRDLLPIWAR